MQAINNEDSKRMLFQKYLLKSFENVGQDALAPIIESENIKAFTPEQLRALQQARQSEAIKDLNQKQRKTIISLGIQFLGEPHYIDQGMKLKYGGPFTTQRTFFIFRALFHEALFKLVSILATKKSELKAILYQLRYSTICRLLQIPFSLQKSEGELFRELKVNLKLLITLVYLYSENYQRSRSEQYEIYALFVTRSQFDSVMEYFQLIDLLSRINRRSITEDEQILFYNSKFCKPTILANKQTNLYRIAFQSSKVRQRIKRILKQNELVIQEIFSAEFCETRQACQQEQNKKRYEQGNLTNNKYSKKSSK